MLTKLVKERLSPVSLTILEQRNDVSYTSDSSGVIEAFKLVNDLVKVSELSTISEIHMFHIKNVLERQ